VITFENNQLIVFQHNDTNHAYFHVVANRINFNGKTTAYDGFSYLKIRFLTHLKDRNLLHKLSFIFKKSTPTTQTLPQNIYFYPPPFSMTNQELKELEDKL
jgi:hypothetical protein